MLRRPEQLPIPPLRPELDPAQAEDSAAGPMLGAQRRIEARIGELLGEGSQGRRTDLQPPTHAEEVLTRDADRADFRLLARAARECDLAESQRCRIKLATSSSN